MTGEIVPGYGRVLAEAREAKGMSVAEVADKLKLSPRQIEALESEDAARLPAPVFVRGFIRNYARLVEVAIESLPALAEVPAEPTETITAHSEELRFSASPVRRWLLLPMAVFAAFLVLVAILYAWLSQGEEAYVPNDPVAVLPTVPPPPAPVNPVQPAPVAVPAVPPAQDATLPPPAAPGVQAAPVPAQPAAVPPVAAPAATPAPTAVPPSPARPVTPAPAPSVVPAPATPMPAPANAARQPANVALPLTQPPAPAATPAAPVRVVQMVTEQTDAWIEVTSGDNKRYTRLLRPGEQLTLRGSPPFRMVVGNAGSVRLNYNGRAIDLKPYTGDKVARLTLE